MPGPGKPFQKGKSPGRPKGVPNRTGQAAAQMVLEALEQLGGVEWLKKQAETNPAIFGPLLGRLLPREQAIELHGGLTIEKWLDEAEPVPAVPGAPVVEAVPADEQAEDKA